MAEMPELAKAAATSRPYQLVAQRMLLPWASYGVRPAREIVQIGAGSGAMATRLLSVFPDVRLVATDTDPDSPPEGQRQ